MSLSNEQITAKNFKAFYERILPYLNGSASNYSTEEQIVGTWIDGKPIYQKTIVTTTPSSLYTDKSVQVNALLDKIITIKASMCINGGWHNIEDSSFVLTTFSSSPTVKGMKIIVKDNTSSNPNVISMICSADNWLNEQIYITIQYTKTTD